MCKYTKKHNAIAVVEIFLLNHCYILFFKAKRNIQLLVYCATQKYEKKPINPYNWFTFFIKPDFKLAALFL